MIGSQSLLDCEENEKRRVPFYLVSLEYQNRFFCCCSVTKLCPTLCDPWTAACQVPMSSTISWSLYTFMSIELVMLFNHLILCHPLSFCLQSFPASGSFPVNWLFASDGQITGASFSASVLPMNIWG